MQSLKLLVIGFAVAVLLPFSAFANGLHGPFSCPKVDETLHISPPDACFSLKASCKGATEDALITVESVGDELSVWADDNPDCHVSSDDTAHYQKKLEAKCEGDDSKTHLKLERKDDLCPPCCMKEVDGSCAGVCNP